MTMTGWIILAVIAGFVIYLIKRMNRTESTSATEIVTEESTVTDVVVVDAQPVETVVTDAPTTHYVDVNGLSAADALEVVAKEQKKAAKKPAAKKAADKKPAAKKAAAKKATK